MNPYLLLKLVHIMAVIAFLGNISTGLFWMKQADKTNDPAIISFTMKNIITSDRWFTIPGVIIITAGGMAAALYASIPLVKNRLDLLVTGPVYPVRHCFQRKAGAAAK